MSDIQLPILLIAASAVLVLVLQIVLLLRKTKVELPSELLVRLDAVEQSSRATLQATAKNEGVLDGLSQQIRAFTQTTSSSLESVRHVVDEKLALAVVESRQGRAELLTAFQGFEGKLESRLASFDVSLTQRLDTVQLTVSGKLEETSKGLLAHLTQAQTDAATLRKELHDALTGFRAELTTAMGALAAESGKSREAMADNAKLFETRIQERFEALTGTTRQTQDSLKADINTQLGVMSAALKDQLEGNSFQIKNQFSVLQESVSQQIAGLVQSSQQNAEQLRVALNERLAAIQQDNTTKLESVRNAVDEKLAQTVAESSKSREAIAENAKLFETRIQERFEALTGTTRQTLDSLKADINTQLGVMSLALKDQLEGNSYQIKNQFSALQESVSQQLAGLVQGSQQNAEQLRVALNDRLAAIQQDNTTKLEEMRRTVDEKLHATLEQRLGESFKLVSERLEQVQAGLGEMKTLASSVGDLKRVMTNVKSRGTWGEMQLGAIIENVLTMDQYGKNVKTVPNSNELVEFAIRLPGKHEEHPIWLPIDSKYPVEHYQRLMDAQDAMDKAAILQAGNAFETSMKLEAKKIVAKYVSPPHTTDFAILYLPTEGLFAEVIRRPGLVEAIQNDCRVMITGPANLAAMLNSLQMGFKTLAIEKRSSEVWSLLGMVKTEFSKFGDIVDATKKSIDAAASKFNEVGVRTRAIQKKLRDVEDLPAMNLAPVVAAIADASDDE